jgi:hypothetical protein
MSRLLFRARRHALSARATRRPRTKSRVVVHHSRIVFARRVLSCAVNSPRLGALMLIKLLIYLTDVSGID